MENYKELYILCEPINTPIGDINFLKVKDYPLLLNYVPYFKLQKFEVIDKIRETSKELADHYQEKQFIEIIRELSSVYELETAYSELFYLCFDKDVFDLITTDEQLEYYLNLIKDMNCISVEKKNPNPEIEYFNELKRMMDKQKNSGITFEAIYTSVWKEIGERPKELYIYEMYSLFDRIAHFKNHDLTALYSSVSSEVKVESWYKSTDKDKKQELTSLEELQSKSL